MNINNRLHRLLYKAGLKAEEAALYIHILENKGCSIIDAARSCRIPKTTAYRAFESLKDMMLIKSCSTSWKNHLEALPITDLMGKLENEQKNKRRLINELKLMFLIKDIPAVALSVPQIEIFKGDKSLEKYLELSEMDWRTNLSFGNWEDLNVNGHLIPLEKKFIKNRLKKGANAYSHLMKSGPCTREITDYDADENRITKTSNNDSYMPMWTNTFEGNNFVYIWTLDDKKKLIGTLIDSKAVADFYRHYIYSLLV